MSTSKKNAETKPLPLSDTLHDLAVLRASDIDLAAFLPLPGPSDQRMTAKTETDAKSTTPTEAPSSASAGDSSKSDRDRLVAKSYEYVREGRAAIRLLHRGDVDTQGVRVDRVRGELEEILTGLDPRPEDKQW